MTERAFFSTVEREIARIDGTASAMCEYAHGIGEPYVACGMCVHDCYFSYDYDPLAHAHVEGIGVAPMIPHKRELAQMLAPYDLTA